LNTIFDNLVVAYFFGPQCIYLLFNHRRSRFSGRRFLPDCATLNRRKSRRRRHWLFCRKRLKTHFFKRCFPNLLWYLRWDLSFLTLLSFALLTCLLTYLP